MMNKKRKEFNPYFPQTPFIDPDMESRKNLPSEAPKPEEEQLFNISEKNVDGKFKIEINNDDVPEMEPPREFVQSSLELRNKLKYILVVLVIIATVVVGAFLIYDALSRNDTGGTNAIEVEKNLFVTYNGSEMFISSDWNDEKSIGYRAKISGGSLFGFELKDVVLCDKSVSQTGIPQKTETFADLSKSTAPITFCNEHNETVGINNDGWDNAINVNMKSHGLNESDIGSVYTDSKKMKFTIMKIVDANNFIIHPSSSNYSRENYSFTTPSDSTLTLISGSGDAKTLKFNKAEKTQLYPFFNSAVCSFKADNSNLDITKSGSIACSKLKVEVKFDVLDVVSVLKYVEQNVGSNNNESYFSNAIGGKSMTIGYTYTFAENGSCTVKMGIEAITDVRFSSVSGIASPIIKSGNAQYVYIPNTLDYYTLGDTSKKAQDLNRDKWKDKNVAPYRFYTYSNNKFSDGLSIGYCFDRLGSENEMRNTFISKAAKIDSKNALIIPYIINKDAALQKNDRFEFLYYIAPFDKGSETCPDKDFSAICWYWVDNDIYLMIDAHKAIDKEITLPSYMKDMRVTPIDVCDGTFVGTAVSGESTIHIKVSTKYGYAVLKLTK